MWRRYFEWNFPTPSAKVKPFFGKLGRLGLSLTVFQCEDDISSGVFKSSASGYPRKDVQLKNHQSETIIQTFWKKTTNQRFVMEWQHQHATFDSISLLISFWVIVKDSLHGEPIFFNFFADRCLLWGRPQTSRPEPKKKRSKGKQKTESTFNKRVPFQSGGVSCVKV